MGNLGQRSIEQIRKALGPRSPLRTTTRALRNYAKFRLGRSIERRNMYLSPGSGGERFGIYALGGCDCLAVVRSGPALAKLHDGPLCITSYSFAAGSRSDFLLQTLDPPTPQQTADIWEPLQLPADYFSPRLFEPHFTPRDQFGVGHFPKRVVVLTLSTDSGRSLYRHRRHGYLIDPGGWWLNADMKSVLGEMDRITWLSTNFEKVGRLSVEESITNFSRLIDEVRRRMDAIVVVMNVLTVDPGRVAMDYQHANSPHRVRRRELGLALWELSNQLDFPVLDVDRITKAAGIAGQADFVHYTPTQKRAIAREFTQLLLEREIFDGADSRRTA